MAIKEKKGRGASAAQGALAGAKLGALAGPAGIPLGALTGAFGGAVFGGDEFAALKQKELEELLEQRELGALGFSDEEMAALRAESQGRVSQQKRDARTQQAKLTASTDLGARAAFVNNLETDVQFAELEQKNADQLALLNMQEQMKDEARIQKLTGEMSKINQKNQEMVLSAAFGMADLIKEEAETADQDALALEQLQANVDMAEKLKDMGITLEGMSYEELSRISSGAAG